MFLYWERHILEGGGLYPQNIGGGQTNLRGGQLQSKGSNWLWVPTFKEVVTPWGPALT